MRHTIVGVDIAKNVMQIHWVDADSGEIVNKPIKRAAFLEYFPIVLPVWSAWSPVEDPSLIFLFRLGPECKHLEEIVRPTLHQLRAHKIG